MNEYPDNELINMISENSEDARDYVYEKYHYIIDIICNKYKKAAYVLDIDFKELEQEAMVGFSDALVNYADDRDTTLPTFITICVERRVTKFIRKSSTDKDKARREAYSLEAEYDENVSLLNFISSPLSDPSITVEAEENIRNLKSKIKDLLSPLEYEVYKLMLNSFNYHEIASILNKNPKQIDNTMQRIRTKIKDLLKK